MVNNKTPHLTPHPLPPQLHPPGAVPGVTGPRHELLLPDGQSVLIDCGLFQGAETSPDGAGPSRPEIDFPIDKLRALVVTHVHIDHVGRIPYLLAAGFEGPILCSEASATLLPMVLEDALKVGVTRNQALIDRALTRIRKQIQPLPYKHWHTLIPGDPSLRVKLQPAGHILGSAYVEFDLKRGKDKQRIVFSGDLGAPYTPLLPAPKSPERADMLVMESTYGDRTHESRRQRRQRLQAVCEHAFGNKGTVLIPAFSIGRTQELLYELEEISTATAGAPPHPASNGTTSTSSSTHPWRRTSPPATRSSGTTGTRKHAASSPPAATRWPSNNSPPSTTTPPTCARWTTWPAPPARPS